MFLTGLPTISSYRSSLVQVMGLNRHRHGEGEDPKTDQAEGEAAEVGPESGLHTGQVPGRHRRHVQVRGTRQQ